MRNLIKNKRGAIEMTTGTIVVLVLAVTFLVLGVFLINSLFGGMKYNVDQMNDKVRDEINKLFVEDKRMVVYLANQLVEISHGKTWGVAFCIKNLETGTNEAAEFNYEVAVQSNVAQDCKISEAKALSYIKAGQAENKVKIAPGQTQCRIIRFQIPDQAPLCIIRYAINVNKGDYAQDAFDLQIK